MDARSIDYGVVVVRAGRLKGRILYYDDDDTDKTAICYYGHPFRARGYFPVRKKYLGKPNVGDFLARLEVLNSALSKFAFRNDRISITAEELNRIWSERDLIEQELFDLRSTGMLEEIGSENTVFLCHASSDKGFVRQVNDDLRRLGVNTWLDENVIHVGDSIVAKISEGLSASSFLVIFLSEASVASMWTQKEWQSFLHRQLSGSDVRILPVLIEDCEVPAVLCDLKYADFRASYDDGLQAITGALIRKIKQAGEPAKSPGALAKPRPAR